MTREPEPITDEQVDAYLDGLMQPEKREAFEARLRAHPEIGKELQLQAEIDSILKRLFPQEQISDERLSELLAATSQTKQVVLDRRPSTGQVLPRLSMSRTMQAAIVGLAAALAWVVVVWQQGKNSIDSVFFEARPVAMVYQEIVDSGFEPYYECHEEERFRAIFLQRQGQELRLTEFPEGSWMLGLSYPGGLSRDTTAMLCRVDQQPVMVFVDRLTSDSPLAMENESGEIKVFRVARDGLVFYEVTPFDSSRVIEHLVPQN